MTDKQIETKHYLSKEDGSRALVVAIRNGVVHFEDGSWLYSCLFRDNFEEEKIEGITKNGIWIELNGYCAKKPEFPIDVVIKFREQRFGFGLLDVDGYFYEIGTNGDGSDKKVVIRGYSDILAYAPLTEFVNSINVMQQDIDKIKKAYEKANL